MASETTDTRVGAIAVLVPPGNLITDEENDSLGKAIAGAQDGGNRCMVVDLHNVELVNSVGLGILIDGFRRYRTQSGHFKLCAMTRRVHRLVAIIKLLPMIEYFDTVEDALRSFQPGDCA